MVSQIFKPGNFLRTRLLCYVLLGICVPVQADQLPGAAAFSEPLQAKLAAASRVKARDYPLRSEHLHADGSPRFTNRLILEDSPYLLQHAHNPVNWHAWGKAAFAQARREHKPVFLSIGYSTCHWCHVMEKESFESIKIARYLNQHFIAIKVDRERRPHIDEIYMTALLLMKGSGGWPMSSFLLPNGKSFYAGTYYPAEEFHHLLEQVVAAWNGNRNELTDIADKLAAAVQAEMQLQSDVDAGTDNLVQTGVRQIMRSYDRDWGGFGEGMKFPNEASLLLLLQYGFRRQDQASLDAVEHSLVMMSLGGIYDHIGGGFHRYATDPYWRVPHFEKMLYNQAALARLYAMAYRIYGRKYFRDVAGQTIEYVLRDMKSPAGGFYSASDADSEGGEGAYYTWSLAEISKILPAGDAKFVEEVFGMTAAGNFKGRNILYMPLDYQESAKVVKLDEAAFMQRLDSIRKVLLAARQRRAPPLRDEKIIVAWNSMMITALVEAGSSLGRPQYISAAIAAADFLWTHQWRRNASLWRVYYRGRASIVATQDDYAFFAEALVALYDATGNRQWLRRAEAVSTQMIRRFADMSHGGFYMNEDRGANYVSPMQIRDNAVPSGNAVAMQVLTELSRRTPDRQYKKLANLTIGAFASALNDNARAYPAMLSALDAYQQGAVGALAYSQGGIVKISAESTPLGAKAYSISIVIQIAEGWHINSSTPVQDKLVALQINTAGADSGSWVISRLQYPAPLLKKLPFEAGKMSLYEGEVQINFEAKRQSSNSAPPAGGLNIVLRVQACNDRICLLPEDLTLELAAPG